jgi:hypothetical protein
MCLVKYNTCIRHLQGTWLFAYECMISVSCVQYVMKEIAVRLQSSKQTHVAEGKLWYWQLELLETTHKDHANGKITPPERSRQLKDQASWKITPEERLRKPAERSSQQKDQASGKIALVERSCQRKDQASRKITSVEILRQRKDHARRKIKPAKRSR